MKSGYYHHMDYQILCFSVIINLLIINSHAVGMDSWVLTAAKSIFRESIFLDQLYTFSLLSFNSFYAYFRNQNNFIKNFRLRNLLRKQKKRAEILKLIFVQQYFWIDQWILCFGPSEGLKRNCDRVGKSLSKRFLEICVFQTRCEALKIWKRFILH